MLINEEGKFRKIISKEKEMLSKTTKRNYKWDIIQHLNHQVQHNQRNIKIRDTQTAIIQTRMKVMTNLTTSSQKTSSATITNLTKKKTIAKNELITIHITNIAIIFTKPLFGLPKSTPTTKSNHFIFKDDSKNSKTYSRLKLKKYLITLHLKITH